MILRARARAKFSRADRMYFTRDALEQSSGETVARYRAERFAAYPAVGDFCCGAGGDATALAGVTRVTAIDADPLRLAMAGENLAAYGVRDRVNRLAGDLMDMPLPQTPAAFFDPRPPRRRAAARRHPRIPTAARCGPRPAISRLPARRQGGTGRGMGGVAAVRRRGSRVHFRRRRAEGVRAVVRVAADGAAAGHAVARPAQARRRRARPGPAAGAAAGRPIRPRPRSRPRRPRSNLGDQLDAYPLDPNIAYLTGESLRSSPFISAHVIEESLPFHLRRLGERLRALGVGHVTVIKRGSAVDPADLVRRLRLSGPEYRVVVLTRVLGRPFALIARPGRCG